MKELLPILTAVEKAAVEGLKQTGREVLKLSNQLAPKDDRDLIKSGRVTTDDLTVQVSYTAPHAALQHEHLDWQHADGGQAKFLETAAQEVDVERIVAQAVRRDIDG